MAVFFCNSWRRSSDWNVLYCWILCYIRNAQLHSSWLYWCI